MKFYTQLHLINPQWYFWWIFKFRPDSNFSAPYISKLLVFFKNVGIIYFDIDIAWIFLRTIQAVSPTIIKGYECSISDVVNGILPHFILPRKSFLKWRSLYVHECNAPSFIFHSLRAVATPSIKEERREEWVKIKECFSHDINTLSLTPFKVLNKGRFIFSRNFS